MTEKCHQNLGLVHLNELGFRRKRYQDVGRYETQRFLPNFKGVCQPVTSEVRAMTQIILSRQQSVSFIWSECACVAIVAVDDCCLPCDIFDSTNRFTD